VETLEAIRTKRAVRAFTEQPLPDGDLQAIVNAGRRAQSSKNRQAWHFILIQDRDTLTALSELGQFAGQLAGAPAAVAILTPDPAERWSVMFDAGQAAAYMQLAAWELGIGSCPVTIYEPEPARELLGFPAQMHLRAVLSLGYPADPAALSSAPQAGGRKSLSEVMSYDRWEGAAG
jgi:nitroreductase